MGFLRSSSDAADPKLVGMCMCRTDREREQLAKRLSKEGPMIRSILKPDELILGITRTEETMTELVVVTDRRVFVVRNLKVKNISAHSEIRKKDHQRAPERSLERGPLSRVVLPAVIGDRRLEAESRCDSALVRERGMGRYSHFILHAVAT